MSGILDVLYTGRSSVLAHQLAVATASDNAANVGTDGFSKRDARFESLTSGGVSVTSVRRRVDAFLGDRILTQNSRLFGEQSRTSSLKATEQMFSESEANIGSRLDAFFDSIRSLSSAPADQGRRRDVLSKAESLTTTVSNAAVRMQSERRQADSTLDGMIGRANELLSSVAQLNQQILANEGTGKEASALRDRQDIALEELSQILDISSFPNAEGQVTVLLAGGRTVVQEAEFSTLQAVSDTAYGGFRRVDVVDPGGVATDITTVLRRGSIGGVLALRDDDLPTILGRLDDFTYDLVNAFNATHQLGYGTDGLSGRDFFSPLTTATNAAQNFDLDAGMSTSPERIAASTSAAEAIGGNDNLLGLQDLEDQNLANGGTLTFREEIAGLVGLVGRMVAENTAEVDNASVQLEQTKGLKQSTSGVALDEELIDITRFQRAYQAGARVIKTADEMFQTLLQI